METLLTAPLLVTSMWPARSPVSASRMSTPTTPTTQIVFVLWSNAGISETCPGVSEEVPWLCVHILVNVRGGSSAKAFVVSIAASATVVSSSLFICDLSESVARPGRRLPPRRTNR
jgi:hypothetical protein